MAYLASWLGLDWGTVPTWVGSVLTGSSLLIAALAYRRGVREREFDQARKISAWYTFERIAALHVVNHSEAAVYVVSAGRPNDWKFLGVIPPGGEETHNLADPHYFAGADYLSAPSLFFRDAVGRYWERNERGRLVRSYPVSDRGDSQ
jgi:hypothetical protein